MNATAMVLRRVPSLGPLTTWSLVLGTTGTILGFVFTETGPIAALLAGNLTLVVWGIEHLLSEQRAVAPGDVHEQIRRIRVGYLQTLAGMVLANSLRTVDLMVRPTYTFPSSTEYFHAVARDVRRLANGDSFFVICNDGASRWQSHAQQRYVAANYMAVGRGADVRRILLARQSEVVAEAQKQADNGIKVSLVRENAIDELDAPYCVPTDLGLGVINNERVYIHSGVDETWYGCMIESPELAAVVLKIFSTLEGQADLVSPKPTKGRNGRR